MSDSRIRKSVVDLSEADLARVPAWEFALDEECEDGQDETTVRPCSLSGSICPRAGLFVVRARFNLADGTEMIGYVTPPTVSGGWLGTIQPTIVVGDGQVAFWCGMVTPRPELLQQNYDSLGKSSSSAFPIQFHSEVPLVDGAVQGEIAGFLVLEDLRTRRIRIVR